MRKTLTVALLYGFMTVSAWAGTHVFGFYGWGDNFLGSSRGIDQIAAKAARIPGVSTVHVYNYWQTQQAANEMMAYNSHDPVVLYGYSCGANAITMFFNVPRQINIAGIQESLWCGGYPIQNNVRYAQETYAGCIITLGFGCKKYQPAPGFTGRITLIRRPDLHGQADTDPNAQNDVLSVIAATANPGGARRYGAMHGQRVREIVRYNGQRP